jgi:hypothetical protein
MDKPGHGTFHPDAPDQMVNSAVLGPAQTWPPGAGTRFRMTFTALDMYAYYFAVHNAELVMLSAPHCAIVALMNEVSCSTPGCSRRVPADSKIHRIVLHDPGTRVLGILYYCSPCLEHFASYGPYGHFAPRYGPTPMASHQSLVEWSAWVDQLLEEDP